MPNQMHKARVRGSQNIRREGTGARLVGLLHAPLAGMEGRGWLPHARNLVAGDDANREETRCI